MEVSESKYIKVGRTMYKIITSFKSADGRLLYVGETFKNDGLYHHVFLYNDEENDEWSLHI